MLGRSKRNNLFEEGKDGSIRFQGEIPHPDGTSHLDRTTLTPVAGARVHQVIEISRDAGKTWTECFRRRLPATAIDQQQAGPK